MGSVPGLGRSPEEGNSNPLQYSCLENLMDRGTWQATAHGVTRVGHDLANEPPAHIFAFTQLAGRYILNILVLLIFIYPPYSYQPIMIIFYLNTKSSFI